MIYIDIGAYNGDDALKAASLGYNVIAFEPNYRMAKILEKINVVVINAAAWNEDGWAPLYEKNENDNSDMGMSLIQDKNNVRKDKYQNVRTINLGRYLKELNEDIEVLKIDAEGAEYYIIESVLDNFNYNRIKRWLVEDHSNRIESDEWQKHRLNILKRLENLNIKIEDWHGI